MISIVNKRVIAVATVILFVVTFASFLMSNGAVGYNESGTNVSQDHQYSSQNNLLINSMHDSSKLVQASGLPGNILGKQTTGLNAVNSSVAMNSLGSDLQYNITIDESGLNLSCANWETELVGTSGTSYTTTATTSSSATASFKDAYFYQGYNYKLVFSVSPNTFNSHFVTLYNLNISVTPLSDVYNYTYSVDFPALFEQTFTFTNVYHTGSCIEGTISFNNTSSPISFSQSYDVGYLALPKGDYKIVLNYNYSQLSIPITVSGKASYSVQFELYKVEITVSSNYSISSDELFVEEADLNPFITCQNTLPMQLNGNNSYVAYLGNGSYTILLIVPITYTVNGYAYQDLFAYALDQDFSLSGAPLSIMASSPSLTTHLVTFSGVSDSIDISLEYEQSYACGFTNDLFYNSTSGTISENITTLSGPVVIEADVENSSQLYSYRLAFCFDSPSGANITVPLHKVSVDAVGTVAGSSTEFAATDQIHGNFGISLFGNLQVTFFNIDSNNATFYLPSSGSQIQVKNDYSNSNGCLSQTFTDNITSSTQEVNADFLTPHNISLSLSIQNVPIGSSHSISIYGQVGNISFTSTSYSTAFISPYANVSVYLHIYTCYSLSQISYCDSFYSDINTNSASFTIYPLYLHTIEIANPLINVKGDYLFDFAISSSKITDLNYLNQYSHSIYNVSSTEITVTNSTGKDLNLTFLAQNGTFYAYTIFAKFSGTFQIGSIFSLSYSFLSVGTISLNSTSVTSNKISIPEVTLATVTINQNGLPLPSLFSYFSSTSGNYFGFVYAESFYPADFYLGVKNVSLNIILPVSTSVQVTMYSDTPFIMFDPESESCSVSNHTDYKTGLVLPSEYKVAKTYTVSFVETGLPTGTSWSVTFNGSTNESSTNTITFTEANSSYQFTIASISGYTVSPASGTIIVNGSSVSKDITFTLKSTVTKYLVSFVETGLPSGTSWSVTVDSMTNSSTGNTISFMLPDGNYSFTSSNNANYSFSGPTTVKVDGSSVTVNLTFFKTSSTVPPPHTGSVSFSSTLIYAIAAVVVIGVIAFVFRAIRKK